MIQALTQGESNLVNDPEDNSSDTGLSLPEIFTYFNPLKKSDLNNTISPDFPHISRQ